MRDITKWGPNPVKEKHNILGFLHILPQPIAVNPGKMAYRRAEALRRRLETATVCTSLDAGEAPNACRRFKIDEDRSCAPIGHRVREKPLPTRVFWPDRAALFTAGQRLSCFVILVLFLQPAWMLFICPRNP